VATFSIGGTGYHLRLTHGLVKRVKAESGVDFYALADDPERYVDDLIVHTHRVYPGVYAAVKDQTPLDYEAWLDPLDADAAASIRAAVAEEFAGFFPGLPTSERLRAAGTAGAFLADLDRLISGRPGGTSGPAGGPGPSASAPTR
jgi:hypothetical protein